MATTYDFVAANKRRSILLVVVFCLVIVLIGWAFSQTTDGGPGLVFVAGLVAVIMSLGGYYGGDRIALMTSGARGPIQKSDNPYLYTMVENLSITEGLPMPKVYVIPDPAMNAFATGRDPQHASIAVTQGALEKLANEELEGVLAHELSHIKNYDVRFMTLVAVLVGIIAMLSDFYFRSMWFGGNRRRDNDSGGNQAQGILMLIGLVLLIFAPIIGQLIKLAVSRRREFLADASGALLTRYPEGLAQALEKIGQENKPLAHANTATAHLYISNPFGRTGNAVGKLFSTHPPLAERVAALRAMGSTHASE